MQALNAVGTPCSIQAYFSTVVIYSRKMLIGSAHEEEEEEEYKVLKTVEKWTT
jgi:hypothetical protein